MGTLQSKRVVLRICKVEDLLTFHQLINDLELARMTLSIPHPINKKTAKHWLDHRIHSTKTGKEFHWAITRKSTDQFIGTIGLYSIDSIKQQAELGFWIGRAYWNKGYCSEAIELVMNYAFQTLDLKRVIARHIKSNHISSKLLRNVGMQESHSLYQYSATTQCPEEVQFYSIQNEEVP